MSRRRGVVAGCALGATSGWNFGNIGGMASELADAYGVGLATVGLLTDVLSAAPDQLRDERRVERGAALGDPPHRSGELVHIRHPVLEQIADSLGALGQKLHRVCGLDVL